MYWILFLTILLTAACLFLNRNMVIAYVMCAAVFIVFIFIQKSPYFQWFFWILLYVMLGWIISVTRAPVRKKKAVSGTAAETDVIHVNEGDLCGVFTEDHAVEIYAGIPYAKPPVGDLRWRAPQEPELYHHLLHADTFAPMPMQPQSSMLVQSVVDILLYKNFDHVLHERVRYPMSENCLYLNIWKPAGHVKNLPVLFYIHGGSLTTGQSWWEDYSGESYARKNVIFITFSYRLGAFGFFADQQLQEESPYGSTGMYGVMDQIQALRWVRANIASFGGDPDNITIAGESAGSSCVNALCTSPLCRGMFQNAIGESSAITAAKPAHSFITLKHALSLGDELKKKCHAEEIGALRQLPASLIIKEKAALNVMCSLCVDGYVLKETPYESYQHRAHNEHALLNGYNLHDGDFFALVSGKTTLKNYHQKLEMLYHEETDAVIGNHIPHNNKEADALYKKLFNQYMFAYGHIAWSHEACLDESVFTYIFAKNNRKIGSNHTGELQYAYGNLHVNASKYNEDDMSLSNIMQSYWINFIRSGNPNGDSLPLWNTFDQQEMMCFDQKCHMISVPLQSVNAAIDKLQNH